MIWKKYEEPNLDDIIINIVDDELAEEGLGKLMTFGTLLFLLGTSGMANASELRNNLGNLVKDKRIQQGKATLTKKDIANAVKKSQKKDATEMVGNWEKVKAMNVVARTLYMEARGEKTIGMRMVMTVIWNRAGGDKTKLADVCLARKQFSCWNNISNKSPDSYKIEFPTGSLTKGADQTAWKTCCDLAQSAFDGTFTPDDPHWNSYYANTVFPSWASDLKNPTEIGNHTVGELAWLTKKTKSKPSETYIVKTGDTLYDIAGKSMKKVNILKQLNGLKSDTIRPGQVLKLS